MDLSSINISAFVLRYCRKLGEAGETVRKVGGKDKECDNQRVELAVALLERLSPGLTQRDEPLSTFNTSAPLGYTLHYYNTVCQFLRSTRPTFRDYTSAVDI